MTSEQLSTLLMPAAIGAVGGGALSAHLSNQSNRRNEDPAQKRKRVLRNALLGSAMGAGAGALLPGAAMIHGAYTSGAKPGLMSSAADATLGGVVGNAAGLGVAGLGAFGVARHHRETGDKAREKLTEWLHKGDPAGMETSLQSSDALRKSIFKHLKDNHAGDLDGSMSTMHKLDSYLRAAGHTGLNVEKMTQELAAEHPDLLRYADQADMEAQISNRYSGSLQKHLQDNGGISKRIAKLMGSAQGSEGFQAAAELPFAGKLPNALRSRLPSPTQVATGWQKHINPTAWKMLRRVSGPAAAAGIVPAALLANRLQGQITGE